MIEIHENLFVGSEGDEVVLRGRPGWYFVHACKEPYHREALGYTGRAASKDHPEYLIARRPSRIILNLVDVPDVRYISADIIDAALEAIHENIAASKVLLHCNVGQSRSPSIGLLYLLRHTTRFAGMDFPEVLQAFKAVYPAFLPAKGMSDFVAINWRRYTT